MGGSAGELGVHVNMAEVMISGKQAVSKNAPVGHVYRMSWWFRGFSILFLLFGISVLYVTVRKAMEGDELGWVQITVATVFPFVGAGMTLKAFSARIVFSEGTVEKSWTMRRQSLALDAIRGRREYVVRGGRYGGSTRYLRLEANDDRPPLDFGKNLYRFDDAFWEWFKQLPDLDARDREVHKDSNFGLI